MITGLTSAEAAALVRAHLCGACGGVLVDCWGGSFGVAAPIVRCLKDIEHNTLKAKNTNIRKLVAPDGSLEEFDVVTQKPVNQVQTLVLPGTQEGMLQRVDEVRALNPLWAKDMTAGQRQALAVVAFAYGLDPIMEELILYQGKPMITIKGRRRKDAEAGHHPSVRFRFLTAEEKEGFTDAGVLYEGDLVQVCLLTTEWGNTVEGIGTVSKAQRDSRRQPVVNTNPLEMVQKRAEDRARNMAYGPVPRPQLPAWVDMIEGEGRLVEDESLPAPDPQPRLTAPVPRPASAATPLAKTSAQPPAPPQGQRGPAPAGFCEGHRADMITSSRTKKVGHLLPNKTVCFGIPAVPTSRDQEDRDSSMPSPDEGASDPVMDEAPEGFPPSHLSDWEGLVADVEAAGLTWEGFCRDHLKMVWSEWLKLGGTVMSARLRLPARTR